jgi:hypothetical protein
LRTADHCAHEGKGSQVIRKAVVEGLVLFCCFDPNRKFLVAKAVKPMGRMHTKFANFDCEKAAYKSFRKQFPDVAVKMCSFHVKQALNRKVFCIFVSASTFILQMQAIGMMSAYRDDAVIKQIVRQIGALQLTPSSEWEKCLMMVKENIDNSPLTPTQINKMLEVLEYYRLVNFSVVQSDI